LRNLLKTSFQSRISGFLRDLQTALCVLSALVRITWHATLLSSHTPAGKIDSKAARGFQYVTVQCSRTSQAAELAGKTFFVKFELLWGKVRCVPLFKACRP
jgi:hypothetical protein